ncbi:MAG: DUF1775 domain-containing protein [Solirubrobacterales bacterium]
MRKALVLLVALLVTPALPGVAGAHVDVAPTEAPAGKPAKLNFSVGHGCDGAATTSLIVQVPRAVAKFTAKSTDGWKATDTPGQMKWVGGPLPDHEVQEYPFTATIYGNEGARIPFKLIQGCEGGAQTAWIQMAPKGAPEPETPAPVVTLTTSVKGPPPSPAAEPNGAGEGQPSGTNGDQTATNDVPESSEEDEGLADGLIIAMFALVAVGLLALALYWVRRSGSKD